MLNVVFKNNNNKYKACTSQPQKTEVNQYYNSNMKMAGLQSGKRQ